MTSKIEGVSPNRNITSLDEPDFGTDIFISPFLISFVIIFFRHTDIDFDDGHFFPTMGW